ncbi:MAG: ORF6N domain-containing protein [Cyclobacteriaceae bacterium]|nr:MAG: ORF6N domain-containing protein [Cyclobacteriaceae bacterium]
MGKHKKAEITLSEEAIYAQIFVIRKHKVMLDFHLADLYEVDTKVLNQAVKRNLDRFPDDFMFQLSADEWDSLRSQFVTSKSTRGGRRYAPFAFTEQGVSMLSSVLNSPRAIAVNIQIMRLFVKMRQMIIGYKDLLKKIEKLEKAQMENNEDIASIYNLIKELLEPAIKDRTPVGFKINPKNG